MREERHYRWWHVCLAHLHFRFHLRPVTSRHWIRPSAPKHITPLFTVDYKYVRRPSPCSCSVSLSLEIVLVPLASLQQASRVRVGLTSFSSRSLSSGQGRLRRSSSAHPRHSSYPLATRPRRPPQPTLHVGPESRPSRSRASASPARLHPAPRKATRNSSPSTPPPPRGGRIEKQEELKGRATTKSSL
jgi:hypothetical protein